MIRAGWFLNDLSGGGAERLPLVLGPAMRDVRIEIVLAKDVVRHARPESAPPVRALLAADARLSAAFPRLLGRALEAARGYDVLVGGMEWLPTFLAAWCGLWLRKPAVGIVHNDVHAFDRRTRVPPGAWAAQGWAFRRCRAVVAVSAGGAEAARRFGVRASRLHAIGNPVPAWAGPPPGPHGAAERARVLSIGRLHPVKGFDVVVDALPALADLDLEWAVLGEGPERDALARRAVERGVDARVRLPGFVPDPRPALAGAHAFVLASRLEGLPLALLEAMAAGLPIVATRCGASVEAVLGDEAAGLLVPPEDPIALARALRRVLTDSALAARLGAEARLRARAFEPAAIAARYESVLRDAVG